MRPQTRMPKHGGTKAKGEEKLCQCVLRRTTWTPVAEGAQMGAAKGPVCQQEAQRAGCSDFFVLVNGLVGR